MNNEQILREALKEIAAYATYAEDKISAVNVIIRHIDKALAATATSDSDDVIDCPKCFGSRIKGEKHGVRCAICSGRGYINATSDSDSTDAARWISVVDSPPKLHQRVLVVAPNADGDRDIRIGTFNTENIFVLDDGSHIKNWVQHWMPLPAPTIAATKKESP